MGSIYQQLEEALDASEDARRLIDLCMVLRRQKTGETLLWAGGRWDRIDRRFVEAEPEEGKVIDLEESQVPFAKWFALWLRDYREGVQRSVFNRSPETDVSLAMAGGERRGGKTFDLQICTMAATVDVPDSIGWLVTKTFRERDEVQQLFATYVPAHWYRERKAPEFRYDFIHGSTLRYQSTTGSADSESLKQGRADFVFLNEGQKMNVSALVHSLGGTIDRGGIALVACNPPKNNPAGEWVLELKEAIEEGRVQGCKFFGFSAALNTRINQAARGRFKDIVTLLDPRAAEADADGEWSPVGNVAYRFKAKEHARPEPEVGDLTEELIYKRFGYRFKNWGGVDFQATPYHAGVFLKAYGVNHEGKPIYYAVGEALREGTEDEFLDTVEEADIWTPENTIWVGDASGTWQDGAHRSRGRVSFDVFRARRWRIEPPQKKKTDRGEHPRNPAREDRRTLVNKLLATGRLFVDPVKCPTLALALKKCQWKNGRPCSPHSHITDGLGYGLWWMEPLPRAQISGGPGVVSVKVSRRGSDFY